MNVVKQMSVLATTVLAAACAVPAGAKPRLVFHLDFNTIQMTRPAVEKILEHVASVGYDAILWEIEDKVRWESCPEAVSPDAFSKDEFRGILARAKALGLEPIPLMQTFGHAEYVLGCEAYRNLREDPARKNCFCPVNPSERSRSSGPSVTMHANSRPVRPSGRPGAFGRPLRGTCPNTLKRKKEGMQS